MLKNQQSKMVIEGVKINSDASNVFTNGVKKEANKLIIKNTTTNGSLAERH